jgi:DNA polymerase III subunit epsilon
MIKLTRPVVFFDLEATGVAPLEDRIVDIALIKHLPDGTTVALSSFVNPGLPIPREASAIHHITDDMVKDAPRFSELAPRVLEFIGDADLGGFNVLKYDIPMLQAELRRTGHELKLEGRKVVDAFAIFQRMEPRNLSAAYKLYCGKPLPDAHRAEPDARASAEVFFAQLERYAEIPKDIDAIAQFCCPVNPGRVDAEGKFVWRNGEAAFNFGKHRTLTLREVMNRDPGYVKWLMGAERTTAELARICEDALMGKFPKQAA